ncbi:MAG: CvpA family protein [Pyrinomonadaceae bacterium]
MNPIDLLLIFIVLLGAALGWHRGFIAGTLDLTRWTAGVLLALALYGPLSRLLETATAGSPVWIKPAAFLGVYFSVSLSVRMINSRLFNKLPKEIRRNPLNRGFGTLPGIFGGLILAVIASASLYSLPFSGGFQEYLDQSRLAEPLAAYSDPIETAFAPVFEDAVAETLTRRLTHYPGSHETIELPFKLDKFRPRPDLEAEMLELINRERASAGLAPLKADPEMRRVALGHSADMFRRGYFSHYTPEHKDPFERMKESDVRFRIAGENLAFSPTLKIAHTGLMNSPGHRANILRPQFGRVGIAILDGGRRGLMITQNFRN